MVPKALFVAALCAAVLAFTNPALADEYRAGEFLNLDLPKAVLSPKRLGPATEFAPIAVEAKSDPRRERAEPKTDRKAAVRTARTKPALAEQRRTVPRTKLVRRKGNPLDAQARDMRIQVWPCKSDGICTWR